MNPVGETRRGFPDLDMFRDFKEEHPQERYLATLLFLFCYILLSATIVLLNKKFANDNWGIAKIIIGRCILPQLARQSCQSKLPQTYVPK